VAINDLNACLPQSVTVVYQSVASDGFTVLAPTPYVVTLASLALPEFPADLVGFPGSKLFHCKTLATLGGGGTPTNDATLRADAQAIATVYYRWLSRATTDTAFAGVCPWSSSGLEGEVEWLHASDRIETRVTRPPWLEHQDELLTFGVPNAPSVGYPELHFGQKCMTGTYALPTTGTPATVTPGVWYGTNFDLFLPENGTYLLQADVFAIFDSIWNNELAPNDPSNSPQANLYLALFELSGTAATMILGSARAVNVAHMLDLVADTSFNNGVSLQTTEGSAKGKIQCWGSTTLNVLYATGSAHVALFAMLTGKSDYACVVGTVLDPTNGLDPFIARPGGPGLLNPSANVPQASTTLQYIRLSDLTGVYAGRGLLSSGRWEPLCGAITSSIGTGTGTGTGTGSGGGGGGSVETPCCGNMLPATLYAYVSAQEGALCGAPAGTSGAIALTYADGTWTGSGDYLGTPVTITFTCNGTSCQDFTGTIACDSTSIPMAWSPTRSGDCTCNPLYVFLVDTETGNVANMYITE
jgi:hypothetical protein